ncbi:G-protein coupled receptor [Desmophyllum pertusum]|uniref:G-protein coupled receptor n=1 Tax=Desmophyllum pertusum TaxID=174260 RepID=A0A9X0CPX6_9CNID|nr:G-protein coupled receptor [Desmophyllum pertusum]
MMQTCSQDKISDYSSLVESPVNMNNNHLPQQSNFGVKSLSTLLPFAIAITLTNGLVFVMFYRTRRLRISSNYPLLSLAICDFLTGAINIPYFIVYSFQVVPPPQVGFWMYVLHTLMAVSAAYHILTITAEKYLAIITPLRHLQVTKKMMLKMLVGIWITSAFVAAIPIAWNQSNSRFIWYIIHAAVCLGFVFFVPYAFMIYAFTIMFRVIAKRERPSSSHRSKSRLQKKNINDRKCIIVFCNNVSDICILLVAIFYHHASHLLQSLPEVRLFSID